MNYSGLNLCDTANGPGVRVSLFVSGCSLHCKGCFNQEAWDKNYGMPFYSYALTKVLEALKEPYIEGLSILGGDPMEEYNRRDVGLVCASVKALYPDKSIWLWTGRKFEEIKYYGHILDYVDVLICNPFIEHLKCKGKYYGSSNQRAYRKSPDGTWNVVQEDSPECFC